MSISTNRVVMIVVSLIIIAVVLPIGLGLVSAMGDTYVSINGTATKLSTLVDPTVLTLLTVLLPILVVVSIALYFIPRSSN